jgi:DNA topoisomerase-1
MPLPPNPPPGMMPKGQFDPNPYHMLRAQQQAKSGQPIRVPPNRPSGPPKFFPAPKGAQPALPGTKDADVFSSSVTWDFSPDQPRDQQGQWVSGVAYHADTKQWHGADGDPLPRHVQDMKIPPAWANVRVNLDPDGDLLATGRDAKNRRTAIYSDAHWAKAAEAKYARVREMADKFDKIMGENAGRQASDDANERDHADAFELIAKTGIRPGSDKDTGAETQAYGATTLEGRHVRQGGKRLVFTGKKGVDLDLPVDDEGLAARLGARAKAAGKTGRLFPNVTADSLSAYTHTLDGGGFKTKDLRTRLANATAMDSMKGVAPPSSPTGYRKAVATIAKKVAAKLGNSPTVALASYINPAVFSHWRMHAQAA